MKNFSLIYCSMIFAVVGFVSGNVAGYNCANAQSQSDSTGIPQATSAFPVEHGIVNLNNGALHLELPMVNYAQRGSVQLPATLNYDSNIWKLNTGASGGNFWMANGPAPNGQSVTGGWYVSYHPQNKSMAMIPLGFAPCQGFGTPGIGEAQIFPGITWMDQGGTTHIFPATLVDRSCTGIDGNQYVQTLTASAYATDGSGYYAIYTYTETSSTFSAVIYDRAGTLVAENTLDDGASVNGGLIGGLGWAPGPTLPVDRNGNSPLNSGSTTLDTMSRNLVTDSGIVIISGVGTVEYIEVPVAGGSTVTYIINYKTIPISTSFGYLNLSEVAGNMLVVSSVVLPDGSSYQFGYNTGSFGEINSMTLPHGAQVSFSYATVSGLAGAPPTRVIQQHVGSEGTTNFSFAQGSTSTYSQAGATCGQITNQVTTTSAGSNLYKFSNCSGNILLEEVDHGSATSSQIDAIDLYSYDTSHPCPTLGTATVYHMGCVGLQWTNITGKTTVLPTVGGTGTSMVTDTQYSYDNPGTGVPTSVKQWDYYSGSPSSLPDSPPGLPTREVDTTLGYNVNGALFPTVVTMKDGTGTSVSSTNYTYDEPAYMSSTPSSAPNHSNALVTGNRGNLTTVSQCCGWNGTTNVPLTSHVWYDDAGSVQAVQDANLNKTILSAYDPTDTFPTTIQLPNTVSAGGAVVSHVLSQTYDQNSGQVASSTDQNGQTTSYTFDQYGRPYQVKFSNGGNPVTLQTTTYPSANETDVAVLQSTGVLLSAASFTDTFGRPIQSVQGGVTSETQYDAQGRIYSVTNAHMSNKASTDGTTYYSHDELGRVNQVTMPNGYSTTYTYVQNAVTVTDPLQHSRQMVSDAFGNTIWVYEPDNTGALSLATNYQYNWQNHLTQVLQQGGSSDSTQWRKRIFSYDGVGRTISQTTPEAGTMSFVYDNNGNLLSSQNQNVTNNKTQNTYDSLNRMIATTIGGGPTYTYNYDAQDSSGDLYGVGLLTSVSTNGSSVSTQWQHDPFGRTVSSAYCLPSGCGHTVLSSFDFQGNQTSLTYPDGRKLQWSYDQLNRPLDETYAQFGSTAVNTPYVSNVSYTPGGQVQQATLGTNVQFGATYDVDANLSSLVYMANGTPIVEKTYTWDKNASNLTGITDIAAGRTQAYVYDQLDRLYTFADSGTDPSKACTVNLPSVPSASQSFTLDPWGNMSSTGTNSFPQAPDGNNRIASLASVYDFAGNLQSDGMTNYQYRADGLMTASGGWTYTYDALGQRVRKDNGSSPNEYIYVGGQILAMYNPSTGAWTDRIYGPTGALATVPGTQTGSPVYRAADHLGSLSYTLDSSGKITGASSALPYGQLTATTGDGFPFTDHERDSENGTDATMYRHYASFQGRWLSPDPSNGSYNLLDPQSLNRYSYLNNRPMASTDSLGLDGDDDGGDGGCGDDGCDDGGNWFSVNLNDFWNWIKGFFGGGGGASSSPQPRDSFPTVASDGLPASTQPNGGGAYLSSISWNTPSQGTSGWAVRDWSPGLDVGGYSITLNAMAQQQPGNLPIVLFSTPNGPKVVWNPSNGSWDVTWHPATVQNRKLIPIEINKYTGKSPDGTKYNITLTEDFGNGKWLWEGTNPGIATDHITTGNYPNMTQRWFVNGQRVQTVMGMDSKTGEPILYWQDYVMRHKLKHTIPPQFNTP